METPTIDALPPYSPPAQSPGNTATVPQSSPRSDPETASIRSSAPSYTEPPAYDQVVSNTSGPTSSPHNPPASNQASQQSQQQQQPQGLPRLHYAPGFIPRPNNPFSSANYSVSALVPWATLECNPRRRQYENVARRRVEQGVLIDTLVGALVDIVTPPVTQQTQQSQHQQRQTDNEEQNATVGEQERVTTSLLDINAAPQPALRRTQDSGQFAQEQRTNHNPTVVSNSNDDNSSPNAPSTPLTSLNSPSTSRTMITAAQPTDAPISPHEDPILVGPLAAARARSQRLYREMLVSDPARALAQESHGWDFMLAQSQDWEDRQRTWRHFQRQKEEKQWRWRARKWIRS
jgi:hypothetical protein